MGISEISALVLMALMQIHSVLIHLCDPFPPVIFWHL